MKKISQGLGGWQRFTVVVTALWVLIGGLNLWVEVERQGYPNLVAYLANESAGIELLLVAFGVPVVVWGTRWVWQGFRRTGASDTG